MSEPVESSALGADQSGVNAADIWRATMAEYQREQKPALEALIREWFPYMSEDEVNELARAARAAAAEEY